MYCPIYKGLCSDDCVFHQGVGEDCLIINALQAFIKDKHKISQEQTKNNNEYYIEHLNELYDMCLSTVHSSKENDVYNTPYQIQTLTNYQDAVQENDEAFIIPI